MKCLWPLNVYNMCFRGSLVCGLQHYVCLLAHIVRTDTCFMYLPGKAIFQIMLSCAHSTFCFQRSYISSAFGFHCRQSNLVRRNCQISKTVQLGGRVGSVERPRLQLSDYQNTVNPFPHLTSTSSFSQCSSGQSWVILAPLSDENKPYTGLSCHCVTHLCTEINVKYIVCFDHNSHSFNDFTAISLT